MMNMLENKKFTMHKAPFIRKADHGENTTVMMRDFMIALAPLIIFAWVKTVCFRTSRIRPISSECSIPYSSFWSEPLPHSSLNSCGIISS